MTFTFHFEAFVTITTDVAPFQQGKEVRGQFSQRAMMLISERSFRNVTHNGLEDFVQNALAQLVAAGSESTSR